MLQTLQSDFISLARAKGMSPRRILWRHALRNSLFSLLTAIGIQLGALIGGAVVVETFFDLDGMGTHARRRHPVAATCSSCRRPSRILVVPSSSSNLIIDLLYAVIDPRIRHRPGTRVKEPR